MNDRLTHIDLFAGIGGFSLAASWAGFRTIAFCEKDEWCQKVLAKNFGAVVADAESRESGEQTEPQGWEDTGGGSEEVSIANTNQQRLERLPSGSEQGVRSRSERRGSIPLYPDIKTFPGHLYRGATLLTGGFPCQPFSCAGKQQGKEDDRDLWPFMFRVIKDARPTWIIGENVAGFVKMELDRSISDLESEGYAVRTFIIPACATDAKHRRDRVWIVANDGSKRTERIPTDDQDESRRSAGRTKPCRNGQDVAHTEQFGRRGRSDGDEARNDGQIQTTGSCPADECEDVADSKNYGQSRSGGTRPGRARSENCCCWQDESDWFAQSGMGRVAHGIPHRVDRLKGLGNAIVPQVAYEIMRMISALTPPKTLP